MYAKKSPILFALVAIAALLLLAIPPATAQTFEPGNPSCTDLGYDFGYKPQPEPPPSGTYDFPDFINTVTITSDGTYFDWVSTLGIDAVIVKGGPNANVYTYDPPAEAFSDTGLFSPINPNNNQPYTISHIEFCYDYEVDVSKTADTTFTRTFDWTIEKTVTPANWALFTGDSGTSQYAVTVTKTGYTDSAWAVSGTIRVENNTPYDATIENVTDAISGFGAVAVDCGVSLPYTLASGGAFECTYGTALPDGSSRTNTATVTTSGLVGGGDTVADVVFGNPTTLVNDTINVDDTNGGSWQFSDTGSITYSQTFTCDSDAGQHDNTATIRETGQSSSASVTVTCYALQVTKNAATSFDRTYHWTIDKSADQTELTLSTGQVFLVNYTVVVDATYTDDNYAVSGNIEVNNPAPIAATINGVSDLVSPDITATVNCGVSFPYSLAAGGTLSCTYNADLPDNGARTNTATATLQNYSYDKDLTPTADGTTDFTGSANVSFASATMTEIDECIDVSDTFAGFLGTVCYPDAPVTFSYSRWVGPYAVCGKYKVDNTASFVTNDTGTTGDDKWTVHVNIPCDTGCTLTPGYWKTHSEYGPAPYDDTWALLPNGADTPFFSSGLTYYETLWTPSRHGNAWVILARAYIAAELNVLNGASIPTDVLDAWTTAQDYLSIYGPDNAPKGPTRVVMTQLAEKLDDYNNGLSGIPHCDF